MAPDTTKMPETIIIMPCCAGKSQQPKPFGMCRLNNHFQIGKITTKSWSWSVRGTR